MAETTWIPFEDGRTLGGEGSEQGRVVLDEEFLESARISLEKDCPRKEGAAATPFALTCGIYGWMVHTRYFKSRDVADRALREMQQRLAEIVEILPSAHDPELESKMEDVHREIVRFVENFPT